MLLTFAYIGKAYRDVKQAYFDWILSGPIYAGSATLSPLNKQVQISSNDLGRELQKARHDPKVKAVVLRVDSPGAEPAQVCIACYYCKTCTAFCRV